MDLTLILLFVLGGVAVYATTLWKKIAKLETGLRAETRLLEERKDELEKARKDARERRDELEDAKKQLQEARNKLKKREKDEQPQEPSSGGKKKAKAEREDTAQAPAPVIVRISDQELAAEHQRNVQKLEDEIAALRSELAAAKKREDERAREAERAAKALAAAVEAPKAVEAPAPTPAPVEAAPAGDAAEKVKAELDATRRAAVDRERELRREIRRAQDDAKHAHRRAANNHALYAVLKGQLELAEDRLAQYRLKYENAKSIDDLRRESKKDRPRKNRDRRQENNAEAAPMVESPSDAPMEAPPPVAQDGAPSTIEVSNQDILSQRPLPEPEPAS